MHIPPIVALGFTLGLIFFLFRRESKEKSNVSSALWIPLIWLLITGSRFPSQWLALGSSGWTAGEEGSPLDAVTFLALIVSGIYVLYRRRVTLGEFARNNRWLTVFLLYCLIAILWSDFPFVAGKRWFKILGHPIMALVVLTDPDPEQAVRRLLKRIAYVLVPLSICFIKYFPQYGRGFDFWTGEGYNSGATLNKNELGCLCMVLGLFFFWNALRALKIKDRKAGRKELLLSVGFLIMIWWLLSQASSATSLTSMLVGMITIWALGLRMLNKRYIGIYLVVGILAFAVAEPIFGIYGSVVKSLGRNLTLTDRTDVWHEALKLQNDPILGVGFESFWLGDRLQKMWTKFWWRPLQAHNGYIETYLNLGVVGIVLLAGQIIGTFQKIRLDLLRRFEFGRLRLGFLLAIVVYNYTEAAFVAVSFVWTTFFLIAVDYPIVRSTRSRRLSQPVRKGRGETVVSAEVNLPRKNADSINLTKQI
jgi:exopolysaccharide production protein ExoQ